MAALSMWSCMKRSGIAPLRHDDQLRVVLQIRRFLSLEVAHAERRQPAT